MIRIAFALTLLAGVAQAQTIIGPNGISTIYTTPGGATIIGPNGITTIYTSPGGSGTIFHPDGGISTIFGND